MTMAEVDEVAALLRSTAHEHHIAFAAVDGADPEWPLWYAEHLAPRLSALLGTSLTRSGLVHTLLLAEEADDSDGDGDWADAYARLIIERHARTAST